ncbi:hypothetical protein Pmani_032873, partial [Petrolisthes manimaculis]
ETSQRDCLHFGRFFFPGERVAYKCLEGFVLVGVEERLVNGTVPGVMMSLCVTSTWHVVHLGHKFTVLSVGVTISPGSPQEFTIFVIELLTDNKALYKPCATFQGVFQTHKAMFQCNGGVGHTGQFVYIRDDRDEHEYFGLCEVEVFAFRERIPCGEPEVPVEGEVERVNDRTARFSCRPGYTLEGDGQLTCSSKGRWQGQPPRCKETQCPAPTHISHGSQDVANFRGVYGHGTVVTYTCNPGYLLEGSATATCDHTAHWTSPPPVCRAVWCGTPPIFPHSSYTLLNTSTGIAVYTCHPGHLLHPDSSETVTTCNDAGTWQPINITCVSASPGTSGGGGGGGVGVVGVGEVASRGEGRALSFDLSSPPASSTTPDEPPEGPRGLVAALALVAGLLTAAMLVVGGLLARRPLLATLRPLLHSTTTTPSKTPAATSTTSTSSVVVAGGRSNPLHHHHHTAYTHTSPHIHHTHHNHPEYTHTHAHAPHLTQYTDSYIHNSPDAQSTCTLDPPYERVGTRSEHSYETLRKKSSCFSDQNSEEGYETVREGGVREAGYETVREGGVREAGYETVREGGVREAGYETVREGGVRVKEGREPGYETVRSAEGIDEVDAEEGYETVREKEDKNHDGEEREGEEEREAGYETVKEVEGKDVGYETVKDVNGKEGGYETVGGDKEEEEKEAGYETVKDGGEGRDRERVKPCPPPPRVPPPRSLTPLNNNNNRPCSPVPSVHLPLSPSPSNPLPLSLQQVDSFTPPTSSLPRSLTPSNFRTPSPNCPSPLPHTPSPLPNAPSPHPGSPTPDDSVPDILQHLSSPVDAIPPEILALYARVDKSKKRRKDPANQSAPNNNNNNNNTNSDNNTSNSNNSDNNTSSSSSNKNTNSSSSCNNDNNTSNNSNSNSKRDATHKLVQKFSRMNHDEGSVRPLPPLPASHPPST